MQSQDGKSHKGMFCAMHGITLRESTFEPCAAHSLLCFLRAMQLLRHIEYHILQAKMQRYILYMRAVS